jgi:hypothetical protein
MYPLFFPPPPCATYGSLAEDSRQKDPNYHYLALCVNQLMNLEDREGMVEVGTGLLPSVHDSLSAQP